MSIEERQAKLEQFTYAVQIGVTDTFLDKIEVTERERDVTLRAFFVTFARKFWGETLREECVSYPATWWDAVKERWWFLRWRPVRYTTYRFTERVVYPFLSLPEEPYGVAIEKEQLPDFSGKSGASGDAW